MVRRCFEDPELARAIGQGTWPVRVDVDRRPDLAERFGLGGWPSTAILTPNDEWMTGSTYMDPEDLRELLRRVRVYFNNPKRWTDFERARSNLARWAEREAPSLPPLEPSSSLLHQFTDSTKAALERGEIPGAEAFLALLDGNDSAARTIALKRLKAILSSPLRDSDGTFFNRQLTPDGVALDREKTLAVNAGWLNVVARVDSASAVDLGEALLAGLYQEKMGMFVAGLAGFSEQSGNAAMLGAGQVPARDPAVYASWNAMAVTGFVALYQASGRAVYLDLAQRVMASLRMRFSRPDGGMLHVLEPEGNPLCLLADQALVARAALDIYDADGDASFLRFASALADVMLVRFRDDSGALRDRWPEQGGAVIHAVDRLVPSGNGVAVQVFLRLYAHTGHSTYQDGAGRILAALANAHLERAVNAGALFRGMAMYLRLVEPPPSISR